MIIADCEYTHAYTWQVGNKTIYFKDDDLWECAKELAGKDGISAVIQAALAHFVDEKRRESQGFRRFRLQAGFCEVGNHSQKYGTTERIAFDGLLLAEQLVSLTDPDDPENEVPCEVQFRLYRTQGGNLVFTVEDAAEPMFGVGHYAVYRSLSALREDKHLQRSDPVSRAEFLDRCSAQLGEEWAVWID
jgi:hypothetical protein